MTERNSKRGRKPLLTDTKLQIIRTNKSAKLIINGQDVMNISRKKNVLIVRSL